MKPIPKAVERYLAKRQKEDVAAGARRLARLRDKMRCRACGARWTPDNPVDVHHLKFRSMGGGDCTANLLCLCRCCHALVHAWRLFIIGKSADGKLRFERVKEKKPA